MALWLLWSTRLSDRRLRGGDDALGDRDYSGGSGLSNTTSTHTDYSGTWKIEVISGAPYLVLQDGKRGRLAFRLEESSRGEVLLDGRPYSLSRI
jgi:hypothetical protein